MRALNKTVIPGMRGCNPIGSCKNGGEFLSNYGSLCSHKTTLDRHTERKLPNLSGRIRAIPRFFATVRWRGQLDYTLMRRGRPNGPPSGARPRTQGVDPPRAGILAQPL